MPKYKINKEHNNILPSTEITEELREHINELCEIIKNPKAPLQDCISHIDYLNNNLQNENIFNEQISMAVQGRLVYCLSNGNIDRADELIQFLENNFDNFDKSALFSDEVIQAAQKRLVYCLSMEYIGEGDKLIQFLEKNIDNFDKSILLSDKVLQAAQEELAYCLSKVYLSKGYIDKADKLIQLLEKNINNFDKSVLLSDKVLQAAQEGFVNYLSNGWPYFADKLILFLVNNFENFDKSNFFSGEKVFHSTLMGLSNYININNRSEKVEYYNRILNTYFKDKLKIGQEHLDLISEKKYLDLYTLQKALENNIEIYRVEKGERKINYEEILPYLLKYGDQWQHEQIYEPFMRGSELFGYDLMFEYIDNSNCSLHDKMIGFNDICDLCEKFCKTQEEKKRFFYNILLQVKDDNGTYNEGTAYHHLNAIVRDLLNVIENGELNKILNDARELESSLPNIKELVNSFISDTNNNEFDINKITSKWNNLKNFIKLKEIVDNKEFHIKLAEIRENDPALYNYVKPLLFHKDSKIILNAVREFIEKPDKFFSRGGSGIGPHYAEYGLTGKELQQAIVNGKLDEIQEIRPMEVEYAVRKRSTVEYLREALGIRSQGINGKASNPKNLYKQIQNLLHIGKDELVAIINGSRALVKNEDIDEENEILRILMADPSMGEIITSETDIYRAQIHKKSDPMAVMVGDDTACCMPFGSKKGMVYFFTPNNAIFSIQKKVNGEFRTIAQSVLTLDIDAGISGLNRPEDLPKIPNEAFKKMLLTCDNVEVAPNFKNKKTIDVIEEMYRSFFGSYLGKYAESIGIDNQDIIIGTGYGDALTGLQTEENTFYPTSLLSYSDNSEEESYVLKTNEELHPYLHIFEIGRVESEPHMSKKAGHYVIKNILPSDVLRIAGIENIIYGEMKQGIVEMQKMIEAYLIKEALAERREGFIFKMMGQGEIASYLIATEDNYGDRKEVYIADFASKKTDSPYLNSLMMKTFFKRYLREYENDDYLPPIRAKFREKTSYRFIEDEKRLNRILKHYGLQARIRKYGTEERGEEIFHICTIFLIREDEDESKFNEIIDTYNKAKEKASEDQDNFDMYDDDYYDDEEQDFDDEF